MKILVDKMPKSVEECPYSEIRGNAKGATWFGCTFHGGANACFDVNKCRYFTSFMKKENTQDDRKRNYKDFGMLLKR